MKKEICGVVDVWDYSMDITWFDRVEYFDAL